MKNKSNIRGKKTKRQNDKKTIRQKDKKKKRQKTKTERQQDILRPWQHIRAGLASPSRPKVSAMQSSKFGLKQRNSKKNHFIAHFGPSETYFGCRVRKMGKPRRWKVSKLNKGNLG